MISDQVQKRAQIIQRCGSIGESVGAGAMAQFQEISVSEALVLGLLNQGVSKPKRCKKSVICQAMRQHQALRDNPRMSSLFSRCRSSSIAVYPQAV